jgi:hypothetical protein
LLLLIRNLQHVLDVFGLWPELPILGEIEPKLPVTALIDELRNRVPDHESESRVVVTGYRSQCLALAWS